jgi:hypothetical protein
LSANATYRQMALDCLLMRIAVRAAVILAACYCGADRVAVSGVAQALEADQATSDERDADAYQIYSVLLRTEVPPSFGIKMWIIKQETKRGPLPMCIQPPADQKPTYQPVIENFEQRNRRPLSLQRKFDLPAYDLVAASDRSFLGDRAVLFEVSAIGFNEQHTRALVYVGHHCGSECGGGAYHLLVKHNGKWVIDSDFRGAPSCLWKS